MVNINFKTDENILARWIIVKNMMPKEFANYLWEKYNPSYRILQKEYLNEKIDLNLLEEVKNQEFFKKILKESEENKERIEKNWEMNKEKINSFLNNFLKLELYLTTNCYVVSPKICTGINIGNNSFVWGHIYGLKDNNYDLTYLIHESLHSYFKKGNLTHAIIENIADVELSKYLNKSNIGYEYHKFTEAEHVKIFPYWNLYLNRSLQEIKEEQKLTKINYSIEKFEKFREILKVMNIDDLVKFLENKLKES